VSDFYKTCPDPLGIDWGTGLVYRKIRGLGTVVGPIGKIDRGFWTRLLYWLGLKNPLSTLVLSES
jgi:hypothetical protein